MRKQSSSLHMEALIDKLHAKYNGWNHDPSDVNGSFNSPPIVLLQYTQTKQNPT